MTQPQYTRDEIQAALAARKNGTPLPPLRSINEDPEAPKPHVGRPKGARTIPIRERMMDRLVRLIDQTHGFCARCSYWNPEFNAAANKALEATADLYRLIDALPKDYKQPKRSKGSKAPLSPGELADITDEAFSQYKELFGLEDRSVTVIKDGGKQTSVQFSDGTKGVVLREHLTA